MLTVQPYSKTMGVRLIPLYIFWPNVPAMARSLLETSGAQYPADHSLTIKAGWINELIARLTDSPVQDETTTNRTLDADEATFPLGGQRIFAVCLGHTVLTAYNNTAWIGKAQILTI